MKIVAKLLEQLKIRKLKKRKIPEGYSQILVTYDGFKRTVLVVENTYCKWLKGLPYDETRSPEANFWERRDEKYWKAIYHLEEQLGLTKSTLPQFNTKIIDVEKF